MIVLFDEVSSYSPVNQVFFVLQTFRARAAEEIGRLEARIQKTRAEVVGFGKIPLWAILSHIARADYKMMFSSQIEKRDAISANAKLCKQAEIELLIGNHFAARAILEMIVDDGPKSDLANILGLPFELVCEIRKNFVDFVKQKDLVKVTC